MGHACERAGRGEGVERAVSPTWNGSDEIQFGLPYLIKAHAAVTRMHVPQPDQNARVPKVRC